MKARKVKGLDPEMPLADAAERILQVRLDELCGFAPRALDPAQGAAQHDMRIAAKRLRYVLELTAPFLGAYAATATKRARALQGLLGDVHDCDVLLSRVRAAGVRPGLVALEEHVVARRAELFERFVERWRELEREGFRDRLERALVEREAPLPSCPSPG